MKKSQQKEYQNQRVVNKVQTLICWDPYKIDMHKLI